MRRIASGIATAMLLVACQSTAPQLTEEQQLAVMDTLFQVSADLIAAAEQVDADRVLSFFAEDPGVILDGEVLSRSALEAQVRHRYGELVRQEIAWHPAKVSVLSPDVVLMTVGGNVRMIGTDGDTLSQSLGWTHVWVRQDGAWKLLQAHQSSRPAEAR